MIVISLGQPITFILVRVGPIPSLARCQGNLLFVSLIKKPTRLRLLTGAQETHATFTRHPMLSWTGLLALSVWTWLAMEAGAAAVGGHRPYVGPNDDDGLCWAKDKPCDMGLPPPYDASVARHRALAVLAPSAPAYDARHRALAAPVPSAPPRYMEDADADAQL